MATRRQIRRFVGSNLTGREPGAMRISRTTQTSSTTTEMYDSTYRGGDNQHAGKWLVFPTGEVREVTTFQSANGRFGFRGPLADVVRSNTEFEIWVEKHDPERINRYIDLAIEDLNLRTVRPAKDDTIWLPPNGRRFMLAANWTMLEKVEMMTAGTSVSLLSRGKWEDNTPAADNDRFGFRVYPIEASTTYTIDFGSTQQHDRYDRIGMVLYLTGVNPAAVRVQFYSNGIIQHTPAEFVILPGMWCYIEQPLDIDTPDKAGFDQVRVDANQDVFLHSIELLQSQSVQWMPVHFSLERGIREVQLTDCVGPMRLRVRGGWPYEYLPSDDTDAGAETSFLINQATTYAMVGIGREGEQYTLSAFWEGKAREALQALPRFDGAMHL